MKTANGPQSWSLGVVASALALFCCVACSGQSPAAPATTIRPTLDQAVETEAPVVAGGSWTGTITLHGVINQDATKDISSGDPGSIYYQSGTSHDTTQTDVTDTYSVTGRDPEDVSYGIDGFDFSGTAKNSGTTLERYVQNWNSQNSGCTYKEEVGTQVSGSWNSTGTANGSLTLSDDGQYSIEVSAGSADPNGEEVTPELPHRVWDTFSDISAGCVAKSGGDVTDTQGPLVWWVSSFLGESDVNDKYSSISGQLGAAPGTTIDGSATWMLKAPALKMDITWHLVHDSPIVLPHS
jgi:hypothetical protein